MPVWARDCLSSNIAQTGSAAHPAFYSMGTRVLSREYSGWGVKWTTHLHLVPRLKTSEAIPLSPLLYIPELCDKGKLYLLPWYKVSETRLKTGTSKIWSRNPKYLSMLPSGWKPYAPSFPVNSFVTTVIPLSYVVLTYIVLHLCCLSPDPIY